MKKIDSQEFRTLVLEGKGVCLVDFSATWCGPCQMLAPVLEEVSAEGHTVYSVDVDEEGQLAMEYRVSGVPTMIFFKDGEKKEQLVGLTPKKTILDKLAYYEN
ncbi:thioredoxin [uncultured Murdochiella sp.]|uniref:thioredoxin n=1 Tax=uncultured Murdochiella sp. TaxID=1586095 RepID=UPI0028042005|nr:thioredoxin [uncultured Murdochiella sp.]